MWPRPRVEEVGELGSGSHPRSWRGSPSSLHCRGESLNHGRLIEMRRLRTAAWMEQGLSEESTRGQGGDLGPLLSL